MEATEHHTKNHLPTRSPSLYILTLLLTIWHSLEKILVANITKNFKKAILYLNLDHLSTAGTEQG